MLIAHLDPNLIILDHVNDIHCSSQERSLLIELPWDRAVGSFGRRKEAPMKATELREGLHTPLVRAEEILHADISAQRVLELDLNYGDTDLIRAMKLLEMAGPFTVGVPGSWRTSRG